MPGRLRSEKDLEAFDYWPSKSPQMASSAQMIERHVS